MAKVRSDSKGSGRDGVQWRCGRQHRVCWRRSQLLVCVSMRDAERVRDELLTDRAPSEGDASMWTVGLLHMPQQRSVGTAASILEMSHSVKDTLTMSVTGWPTAPDMRYVITDMGCPLQVTSSIATSSCAHAPTSSLPCRESDVIFISPVQPPSMV